MAARVRKELRLRRIWSPKPPADPRETKIARSIAEASTAAMMIPAVRCRDVIANAALTGISPRRRQAQRRVRRLASGLRFRYFRPEPADDRANRPRWLRYW